MATNPLGNDPLAIELGKRIAADREAKGWTQADLAKGFDLSQGAICKWEAGSNWPKLHNLKRLANTFGWDEDTFLRYALRDKEAAA